MNNWENLYLSKIGGRVMKKISTLGPAGTFSELAALKYIEKIGRKAEISFYPTITKAFKAIGQECDLGVVPIENSLDGHVQVTLDLLTKTDLQIIYEFVIPVQFAFIGNVLDIREVKSIYAQFKTQGQCYEFLEKLANPRIITTESNSESFTQVQKGISGEAAIIPKHMLDYDSRFSLTINNITDSTENETRFIVLAKDAVAYDEKKDYKTSLVIMNALNKPGILSQILTSFSEKSINLSSIISRPTKKALGKYFFFIDIDGHFPKEIKIKQAIDEISQDNTIKILGSYSEI